MKHGLSEMIIMQNALGKNKGSNFSQVINTVRQSIQVNLIKSTLKLSIENQFWGSTGI